MLVNIQDDMIELQKLGLLDKLLVDKTTKGHILWGTDAYSERGESYAKGREIFVPLVLYNNLGVIKTRARKAFEQQLDRTKLHGEVFTPRWVCNMMIDTIDCDWFGIDKLPANAWQHVDELFQQTKTSWKKYVDNKRLEITCGEAPYLVQRYDVADGKMMPVEERTGILDRKLHVVSAYATTVDEWIHWAIRAFEATFGYEYQGDNLLIARVNFMKTFIEFYLQKWSSSPDIKVLESLIHKVTWNVWQMDGLTYTIPCCYDFMEEQSLFATSQEEVKNQPTCKIRSWRGHNISSFAVKEMKGRQTGMKFDYIIGNPPYQEEATGNKNYAPPIYHRFMDEVIKISNKVELIHPARFLFDAGSTPKQWNQKMLNDPHFKVLYYENNGKNIFPNTEIKGGVAITYYDKSSNFGAIGVFTIHKKLNSIFHKVKPYAENGNLSSIMYNQMRFDLDSVYKVYPALQEVIGSKGKDKRFRNNIFDKIPLFTEGKASEDDIAVLGVVNNKRVWRWLPHNFIDITHPNISHWKVLVVRVNGKGEFGETLSTPIILKPMEAYTQTFIGIGAFDTQAAAENVLKYIKTKFARAMLSVLKITQDNSIETWRMIPLQDFESNSDIDWSMSISDIDQQLYKKYGLSEEEIDFIEKNVKEMK